MTSERSTEPLYAAGCEVFDFDADGDLDIHDFTAFGIVMDGRPLPFDFDADGDVDLADYGRFHTCFNGPGPWPASKACFAGDFDRDNDLDLTDLADLLNYFGMATIVPIPANPYYFTGRELDFDIRDGNGVPLLALYHYRARAYDPWHGRFLQRDPLSYKDSLNLYEYVKSNSLLATDPTGKSLLLDLLYSIYLRVDSRIQLTAGAAVALGYFRSIAQALSFRSQLLSRLIDTASRLGQRGGDFLSRANQILQGTAGRVFSAGTYRDAFIWLRGGIQQGYRVHHVFPQKFSDFFASKGINIHVPLWLEQLESGLHARLSFAYNAAWTNWIAENRHATTDQVFSAARDIMLKVFNVPAPF